MCERNSPNKKMSVLSDWFFYYFFTTFVGLLPVRVFVCLFVCLFVCFVCFFLFLFVFVLFLFFSSLFFCAVIFHSVLVQCCSVLFCLGCWRAPFSLLSEPFSSFFPSCLSLVTALIFLFYFLFFSFFSTFVGLPSDRVFLFLSFIFCGHFFPSKFMPAQGPSRRNHQDQDHSVLLRCCLFCTV